MALQAVLAPGTLEGNIWIHVSLNYVIIENLASRTGQELHWYHADDEYHRVPLANSLRQQIVKGIKYEMNEYGHWRAICAYVHIPSSKVDAPGLPSDVIPILPETISSNHLASQGLLNLAIATCYQTTIVSDWMFVKVHSAYSRWYYALNMKCFTTTTYIYIHFYFSLGKGVSIKLKIWHKPNTLWLLSPFWLKVSVVAVLPLVSATSDLLVIPLDR
jgi:hypothetical protein